MKEKEMSTAEEVAYKNSIWDDRNETHRLLSQAAKVLAHRTGLMSLVATNAGDLYYAGIANLLDSREFMDWEMSKNLFGRLDEYPYWLRIINQLERVQQDMLYMLGAEDFSDPVLDNCASIFSEFNGPHARGIIGVLGPKRMYYDTITPQVRYLTALVEKLMSEQE
jgi:heat-inducible transcriptional repressor